MGKGEAPVVATANRRGGLRVLVTAAVAALALAACSGGGKSSAERATTTTVAAAPATTPTTVCFRRPAANPEIDVAANAAWIAWKNDDFKKAEGLVDGIADPALHDQAERAVDAAEAEGAAWKAYYGRGDFAAADQITGLIETPSILAAAQQAVALAQREETLWQEVPRDSAAWSKAYDASRDAWIGLNDQAQITWSDLYRQSSEYCRPA